MTKKQSNPPPPPIENRPPPPPPPPRMITGGGRILTPPSPSEDVFNYMPSSYNPFVIIRDRLRDWLGLNTKQHKRDE